MEPWKPEWRCRRRGCRETPEGYRKRGGSDGIEGRAVTDIHGNFLQNPRKGPDGAPKGRLLMDAGLLPARANQKCKARGTYSKHGLWLGHLRSASFENRHSGHTHEPSWSIIQRTLQVGRLLPVILVTVALLATPGVDALANSRNGSSESGSAAQRQTESGTFSWGPWGQVTSCTRTCGIGVRYRRRVCYRDIEGGGMELARSSASCTGSDRQYELCPDLQECESEDGDFRDQQCAAYNSQPYRGRHYRWEAYKLKPGHTHTFNVNPCALVCCTAGFSSRHFAVRFSPKVRDGTPCDLDLNVGSNAGVCINGTCTRIGCDGRLHSTLVFDRCGVCGGDNNSCDTINGNVTRHIAMGYTDVVTIPRGASSIRVVETVDSSAVFALRSNDGILFVNGRSSESYPTVYRHVAGVVFHYHHSLYSPDGLERLEGYGHTNETLYVMMLQPEDRGGEIQISYEYSVPRSDVNASIQRLTGSHVAHSSGQSLSYEGRPQATVAPQFLSEHSETEEGRETYSAQHVLSPQVHGDVVSVATTTADSSTSTSEDNSTDTSYPDADVGRPGESVPAIVGSKYRNPQTNSGPYRYFWKLNKLAPCSATCTSGVQSRTALCYRSDNVMVENDFCDDSDRPKPVQVSCEGRPCSPRWVASLWSSCSVSCGIGQQFRTVHCWRMMAPGFDSTVHDYLCSTLAKPYLVRTCKEVDCGPLWETSLWGECSRKCGDGVQTRNVRCSSQTQSCDVSSKPRVSRPCRLGPCIHDWVVSDWGECSGGCDSGIRKRSVTCRDVDGNFLHDKYCDEHTRPLSVEACTNTGTHVDCRLRWVPQDWGVCSVDCDWGVTSRTVVCGSVHAGTWRKSEDNACREMKKPRMRTACREPPCKARWYTTNWSQCSKSCGDGGVRVRKVACYRDNKPSRHCDVSNQPSSSELCENMPCQQEGDVDRGT